MIATAVITAGGTSVRFGHRTPKQFQDLAGIPLLIHTLRAFESAQTIRDIIVTLPKESLSRLNEAEQKKYALKKIRAVVAGGPTRQESVFLGLEAIEDPPDVVAVHDAARCLIRPALIDRAVAECETCDGMIVGLPIRDTIKRVKDDRILRTELRDGLWGIQTPQIFRFDLIRNAYRKAMKEGFSATDDAAVAEWFGASLRVTEGNTENFKVTYPADLALAENILRKREP